MTWDEVRATLPSFPSPSLVLGVDSCGVRVRKSRLACAGSPVALMLEYLDGKKYRTQRLPCGRWKEVGRAVTQWITAKQLHSDKRRDKVSHPESAYPVAMRVLYVHLGWGGYSLSALRVGLQCAQLAPYYIKKWDHPEFCCLVSAVPWKEVGRDVG